MLNKRYHYPEALRRASDKFRKTAKERGIARITSAYMPKELVDRFIEIKGDLPWKDFIQEIIECYEE